MRWTAAALGSHTSTCFSPGGSPSKRMVAGPPGWKSTAPVYRSITISVPVRVDSPPASSPSTTRSNAAGGAGLGAELHQGELHVELDRRRVRHHLEPAARRHRLEHRQRDVVVLHARPRRHPVQHDPAVGRFELDDPGGAHAPPRTSTGARSPISRCRRRPRP